VGWVTTPATLASLAHRGRLVVISAVGSRKVEIDLIDLYHNENRIFGSDSTKLGVIESARRLRARPVPMLGVCGGQPAVWG
jgi:NADPH:quinone reductase